MPGVQAMTSKLYEVEVSFTYYAFAPHQRAAEGFVREAFNDFGVISVDATRVVSKAHAIDAGWEDDSLVYHDEGGDITLGSLLDALPEEP